jgi:hypothetical protein
MNRRSITLILPSALLFTLAASPSRPFSSTEATAGNPRVGSRLVSVEESPAFQQKGRFKKQGDNCVWDENDGGPNQCAPQVKGRFKRGANDSCTWDANDVGSDQCRPPKGRWKKGGDDSCAWDAADSGPDQCNPRKAK